MLTLKALSRKVAHGLPRYSTRPLSTYVFSWGDGKHGKLGHGENHEPQLFPSKIDFFDSIDVASVSCGTDHTAAVTEAGEVYTWGNGKNFRLGHGGDDSEFSPRLVEGLEGVNVLDVVCGEQFSAALTTDGRVYTWGDDSGRILGGTGVLGHGDSEPVPLPKEISFFNNENLNIVQIAGGKGHMVALDEHGGVWSWGKGDYGRLGNGSISNEHTPTNLDLFEEIPVKFITAGEHQSGAIADDGEVWMWGRNHQGQLGMGGGLTMEVYAMEGYPCVLASNEDGHEVNELDGVYLACGVSNSAMIAHNGEVYSWGSSGWLSPHRMSILSDKDVWKISCGGGNFFALSRDGALFSWSKSGMGGQSKSLGHGGSGFGSSVSQPTQVEALAGLKIIDVAAGKNHTVVTAER